MEKLLHSIVIFYQKTNKDTTKMNKYTFYKIIHWLCGFSTVIYKNGIYTTRGPKSIIYTLILPTVVITMSTLNYIMTPKFSISPNVVAMLSLTISVHTMILTAWINEYFYAVDKVTVAENLQNVDAILKTDVSKYDRKIIIVYNLYFVCAIANIIFDLLTERDFLFTWQMNLINVVLDLTVLQIVKDIYLNYVRLSFINKKLESREYSGVDFRRASVFKNNIRTDDSIEYCNTSELLNVYMTLCENAQMINNRFSITLFFIPIISVLTYVVIVTFMMTQKTYVMDTIRIISMFFWASHYIVFNLILVAMGEIFIEEDERMKCLIGKVYINKSLDTKTLHTLRLLMKKIDKKELNISAAGNFVFDFNLLFGMIGMTISYTIIAVQMESIKF